MTATLTPQTMVAANHRFLNKICWKRREALEMAEAIAGFFADNDIPLTKQLSEEYEDFKELARLHYRLKGGNKSIVADFAQGDNHSPMLLAHWYTRHRLDPVWNMRKSQLIRKKYRDFLSTHEVAEGHLLIQSYTPVHMVLTLPHSGGHYAGERFYARHLLAAFAEVRRCAFWKKHIYGGEYGLEIKRGKGNNGLHIHMHSLLFLKDTCTVNAFRAWLRRKWEKLTGATFCHFETLYFFKKKLNGQYEMEAIDSGKWKESEYGGYEDEHGNFHQHFHPKFVRKKYYLSKDSPVEDYIKGVMECIKYHFKHEGLKDDSGEWDIPLMHEILCNSRNLRFYSRFGAFYKEPRLNFNSMDSDAGEGAIDTVEEQPGSEESVMGSASGVEERLVNPWTFAPATRDDYTVCIVSADRLEMRKDIRGRLALKYYNPEDFLRVDQRLELGQIIRAVCSNKLREILVPEHWQELVNVPAAAA